MRIRNKVLWIVIVFAISGILLSFFILSCISGSSESGLIDPNAFNVVWSKDSMSLYYIHTENEMEIGNDGTLYQYDIRTRQRRRIGGYSEFRDISPTGQEIVTVPLPDEMGSISGYVKVTDLTTGKARIIYRLADHSSEPSVWWLETDQIVIVDFLERDTKLSVFDPRNGLSFYRLINASSYVDVGIDGQVIGYTAGGNYTISEIQSGKILCTIPESECLGAHWLSRHRLIGYTNHYEDFEMDLTTGLRKQFNMGIPHGMGGILSPDTRRVAAIRGGGGDWHNIRPNNLYIYRRSR
ncbi:MAG: hypothetical protein ACYDCO_08105 [Armatimonadota bacterium]